MDLKKIILVRHGETEWSLSGKHTGKTDVPLTSQGEMQAKNLLQAIKDHSIQHALISPSKRAKDTFFLSNLVVAHELDEDLCEWNYGSYEGMTSLDIQKINPGWNLFAEGAPGGESLHDMKIRADRVLTKALSLEGTIAIFSSGHILRSLAARFLK